MFSNNNKTAHMDNKNQKKRYIPEVYKDIFKDD